MRGLSFAVIALSALLAAQRCEAGELRNIRPRDVTADLLLKFGAERSATFRGLVDDLERSRVIVYIDVRQQAQHPVGGGLQFVTEVQGIRWVRVVVDSGTAVVGRTHQDVVRLTAILAHELQHALEAAEASSLRNQREFEGYFRQIGVKDADMLDTLAAREVGGTVDDELRDAEGPWDRQVLAWRQAHAVD